MVLEPCLPWCPEMPFEDERSHVQMCYISTANDCLMLFLFLPHEKVLWGSVLSLPLGTSERSTCRRSSSVLAATFGHAGWALLSQEGRWEAALAHALCATAPVQEGREAFSELHHSMLGLAEALK